MALLVIKSPKCAIYTAILLGSPALQLDLVQRKCDLRGESLFRFPKNYNIANAVYYIIRRS